MKSHTKAATVATTGTVMSAFSSDDFHGTNCASPGPTLEFLFFKNFTIQMSEAIPRKENTRTLARWITEIETNCGLKEFTQSWRFLLTYQYH